MWCRLRTWFLLARVRAKSIQNQRLFEKQTSCMCTFCVFLQILTSTEQRLWIQLLATVHKKFSLQAPEWSFFTTTPHSTIIPANNRYLELILKAVSPYLIVWSSTSSFLINSHMICSYLQFIYYLFNQQTDEIWHSMIFFCHSSDLLLFLPSTFLLLKVNGIHLWLTGLRCRFQLYNYSIQMIIPQDELLSIVFTVPHEFN